MLRGDHQHLRPPALETAAITLPLIRWREGRVAIRSPGAEDAMKVRSIMRVEKPQARIALARIGTALAMTSMGALALGALAVGAVAVGALAIRALAIKNARIQRLEIEELVICGQPFRAGA
jgi:hypothetical protein